MLDHRKTFLAALMITVSLHGLGQKMPVYENKIYISPEGKMYVQKSMPVFLWLSTSPDKDGKHYLLKSQATSRYTNPMFFDSEGYNSIRSPWCVDTVTKTVVLPKKDIVFEVYADNNPPITSINYGSTEIVPKNNKLYINGQAQITFKAVDQLSGVQNIYVSVDSADYIAYKEPIVLNNEKEYILKYYSVDNVGNVEVPRKVILVLDRTSPTTSMQIKGDYKENILGINASIVLSSEDQSSGVASIKYKLDEGVEKLYTGPINAAYLQQGDHRLSYYSVDFVKNIEKEQVYEFYVDKTPPTIVQEITGKSFVANGKEFSSGRSQLKLTAFDNKAGVKEVYYSINNGKFYKYEKPVLLSGVGGNLVVKAYAVDNVNNKSEVIEETGNKTSIPYVDLSGPTLNYNFIGPMFVTSDTVYINSKTKIQLKAFDNESGVNKIEYTVDQNEKKVYDVPFSIEKEGQHVIQYTGYDNVENSSASSFTIFVDNTGPEIYSRFSTLPKGSKNINGKSVLQYPDYVVLFISATDANTGYDHMTYSINGSKENRFSGSISGFVKNTDIEITIKAYDKLYNESVSNISFSIKN